MESMKQELRERIRVAMLKADDATDGDSGDAFASMVDAALNAAVGYAESEINRAEEWIDDVEKALRETGVSRCGGSHSRQIRELMRQRDEAWAFLRRTAMAGGSIVSSLAMTPTQIAIARAADRMLVTPDGYGYAYVPGARAPQESDTETVALLAKERDEALHVNRNLAAQIAEANSENASLRLALDRANAELEKPADARLLEVDQALCGFSEHLGPSLAVRIQWLVRELDGALERAGKAEEWIDHVEKALRETGVSACGGSHSRQIRELARQRDEARACADAAESRIARALERANRRWEEWGQRALDVADILERTEAAAPWQRDEAIKQRDDEPAEVALPSEPLAFSAAPDSVVFDEDDEEEEEEDDGEWANRICREHDEAKQRIAVLQARAEAAEKQRDELQARMTEMVESRDEIAADLERIIANLDEKVLRELLDGFTSTQSAVPPDVIGELAANLPAPSAQRVGPFVTNRSRAENTGRALGSLVVARRP